MSAVPALAPIVEALVEAGVPHMLAGSLASGVHGIARTTADVDLVVELDDERLARLVESLDPERFYVPVDTARRAVVERSSFNVIDTEHGWKVDLIVRRDRPFSISEFARRERVTVSGVDLFVATAEDTILAKLEWARLGSSDRQVDDVVGILRVRTDLDDQYLDRWAPELGVQDLLAGARRQASTGST